MIYTTLIWATINTFLHALSKSCMNVVTLVCQVHTSMHVHVHACMYALGVQRVKLIIGIINIHIKTNKYEKLHQDLKM